jgi:DNA-binding transcriptional MerR regulator
LTLQNILALKFLGFSLEEIRMLLQTGPKRLEEVLAQQKERRFLPCKIPYGMV